MEILKYLTQFLIESSWLNENVPEQARALFTSWCLIKNIAADTSDCDTVLCMLYDSSGIETIDISYDEFEKYMVSLIV